MLGRENIWSGTGTIKACPPWKSIDAIATVSVKMTVTPQDQIDRCLECKMPECWGCEWHRRKRGK